MAIFRNAYPYTDFHEQNLDWIIEKVKSIETNLTEWEVLHTIEFRGIWDISKQYPAYSVVSNGDLGYMAIKPVPVGIDITNEDYWLLVADYVGLIGGLEARVSALESADVSIRSDITKLNLYNTKDNSLEDKNIVFVGDSYLVGAATESGHGWGYYVAKDTKCNPFYAYASGCGYIHNSGSAGVTFSEAMTSLSTQMTIAERQNTKFVVCGGGYNDHIYDNNDVYNAVISFNHTARLLYPNAKIINVGFGNPLRLTRELISTYAAISKAANDSGAITSFDLIFRLLTDNIYNSGDNVHPNDAGTKLLAQNVISILNGNNIEDNYIYEVTDVNEKLTINWLSLSRRNGIAHLHGKVTFNEAFNAAELLFKVPWGCQYNFGSLFETAYYFGADASNRLVGAIQIQADGSIKTPTSIPVARAANTSIFIDCSWPCKQTN